MVLPSVPGLFCTPHFATLFLPPTSCMLHERVNASIAERKKILTLQNLTVNCLFQPMTFEVFGGSGPLTAKFLSTLAARLNDVPNNVCEVARLSQHLSLAIALSNVAGVLAFVSLIYI